MDASVLSIWSKHSASKGLCMAFTSQVQVLIAPPPVVVCSALFESSGNSEDAC